MIDSHNMPGLVPVAAPSLQPPALSIGVRSSADVFPLNILPIFHLLYIALNYKCERINLSGYLGHVMVIGLGGHCVTYNGVSVDL